MIDTLWANREQILATTANALDTKVGTLTEFCKRDKEKQDGENDLTLQKLHARVESTREMAISEYKWLLRNLSSIIRTVRDEQLVVAKAAAGEVS